MRYNMDYVMISDQFKLPCPDGFHILSKEEQSRLNLLGDGETVCLSDENRHMLISIGWKKTGMLSALLLSEFSLEKNMESSIRQGMLPYGFQRESALTRQIAGRNAAGFRYTYNSKNIGMLGDSYVLRSGNTVVYFHMYARTSLREESISVWNDLLESVTLN